MSRSPTPPRSALKRTGSEAELDEHRSEAPAIRTRAASRPVPSAADRHSPQPQTEAGPSGTSSLDTPPGYEATSSSSRPRQSPVDPITSSEPLDWPDPNVGEFPSDLAVVPLTDPLSVPLSVEPEHFSTLNTYQWSIKHPTKVEIKNLVELDDDPVVILDQVDKTFSRIGNIVSMSLTAGIESSRFMPNE